MSWWTVKNRREERSSGRVNVHEARSVKTRDNDRETRPTGARRSLASTKRISGERWWLIFELAVYLETVDWPLNGTIIGLARPAIVHRTIAQLFLPGG